MILILQFRTDKSGWHEVKCMYKATKLKYNELCFLNANSNYFDKELFYKLTKKAKGIIIAGLGEGGFEKPNPRFNKMVNKITPLIKDIIERDKPTLGICFGHQLIGKILGSEIKYDQKQAETGIVDITLTKEGKEDKLFSNINTTFKAIEGHQSSVMSLPENTVHLATSSKCNIQAFRYKNNVYGIQFHPELDYEELQFRLNMYQDSNYIKHQVKSKYKKVDAIKVLENFVTKIAV